MNVLHSDLREWENCIYETCEDDSEDVITGEDGEIRNLIPEQYRNTARSPFLMKGIVKFRVIFINTLIHVFFLIYSIIQMYLLTSLFRSTAHKDFSN